MMTPTEWLKRLESLPNINSSAWELLVRSKEVNEQRFFLCLLDIIRTRSDDSSLLAYDIRRILVMNQFRDFLVNVLVEPDECKSKGDLEFIRRLHMITYSHFWECTWVQRLLLMLVRVASGCPYDPEILIGRSHRSTSNVFEEIVSKSNKLDLGISDLIKTIYVAQIRNAVAHSDFWFGEQYIILENHDPKNPSSIPSVSYENWDILFTGTKAFFECLIQFTGGFLASFRAKTPYTFDLEEFREPFTILPDPRGKGWTFLRD